MNTMALRRNHSFRLDCELLDKLKTLAHKSNRSMNSLVEELLSDAVYNEPNEKTAAAYEEALRGENVTVADTSSFEAFFKSCEE